jgi:hypothetical protein
VSRIVVFFGHETAAVRRVAHDMEFNSRTQWVYHRKMCWVWLANFVPITALLVLVLTSSTKMAVVWTAVMLGVNTYYSLYANFCTDYDAVSASYAAIKAEEAAARGEGKD